MIMLSTDPYQNSFDNLVFIVSISLQEKNQVEIREQNENKKKMKCDQCYRRFARKWKVQLHKAIF